MLQYFESKELVPELIETNSNARALKPRKKPNLVFSGVYILLNLLTDLSYTLIDPRIRY